MTSCRYEPRPGQRWPVVRATWRADRWTVDRRHDPAACGLSTERLDPTTWRTR